MSDLYQYNNYDDLTFSEAKDLLRKWRESNERRSQDVNSIHRNVLMYKTGDFGNEFQSKEEQIIMAALDCHDKAAADAEISMLENMYPGSLKVGRYRACYLEALGRYDEALQLLDLIIEADETNAAARKRRIAILKEQGLLLEAIKELVDYLKKFMSDTEAWQELCGLYQQQGEYSRAAFCAEELLLHQPHCHHHHQRLADIRYTMGGIENMELAKTYYCQALKLNPENMRALFGLVLTTNNLLNQYKTSGNSNKRKEAWRLAQWASSKAARKQKETTNDVTQMMLSLAITD